MATKQIKDIKTDRCPRCNSSKLLKIDGTFIKWLKCPKCRFTKVISKKEKSPIVVTPLIDKEEKVKIETEE